MATKSKSTIVKSKITAPKVSRARRSDTVDSVSESVSRDLIALRAYERFVARGCQHGHDVEDWLSAERELTAAS
ncbi:MAG TPA: DUF2934 domain-containing protein [Polyangia bacterium]|jgi:hypothetical protein